MTENAPEGTRTWEHGEFAVTIEADGVMTLHAYESSFPLSTNDCEELSRILLEARDSSH